MKATWNGQVIAESDKTILIENNHYFPPSSIKKEFFTPSTLNTTCSWKGEASYYNLAKDGKMDADAAWYYPSPKTAAKNVTGYVAFYKHIVTVSP